MKLVCAGDSITGASDLTQYLKWSHVLACMMEARRGPGKDEVLNRGIGGNTTRDLLARLDADVISTEPDVVVLLIGGNDAASLERTETEDNLRKILQTILTAGAKLLTLRYHVLPDPQNPEGAWNHLNSNNDIIQRVASERACPVLDMGPLMELALSTHARGELVDEEDGVHLSPAGELVFARGVFHELDRLGWLSP